MLLSGPAGGRAGCVYRRHRQRRAGTHLIVASLPSTAGGELGPGTKCRRRWLACNLSNSRHAADDGERQMCVSFADLRAGAAPADPSRVHHYGLTPDMAHKQFAEPKRHPGGRPWDSARRIQPRATAPRGPPGRQALPWLRPAPKRAGPCCKQTNNDRLFHASFRVHFARRPY